MKKIEAEPEDCLWFYWEGSRYGEILKEHRDGSKTVKDCNGTSHKVYKNEKGKWVSKRHRDFTGQNKLKKEKKDVSNKRKKKKKRTLKIKKRVKVKNAKRKLCDGRRLRIKKKQTGNGKRI